MKSQNLSFLNKALAYLLFVSIVIRFVHCQLTKNLKTEKQFQEFRYFSFAGFVGFVLVLMAMLTTEITASLLVTSWFALFVCAVLFEMYFDLSSKFKE